MKLALSYIILKKILKRVERNGERERSRIYSHIKLKISKKGLIFAEAGHIEIK